MQRNRRDSPRDHLMHQTTSNDPSLSSSSRTRITWVCPPSPAGTTSVSIRRSFSKAATSGSDATPSLICPRGDEKCLKPRPFLWIMGPRRPGNGSEPDSSAVSPQEITNCKSSRGEISLSNLVRQPAQAKTRGRDTHRRSGWGACSSPRIEQLRHASRTKPCEPIGWRANMIPHAMITDSLPAQKLRILLIADLCNPRWTSVPLEAYSLARALAERDDLAVTLVTHMRAVEECWNPTRSPMKFNCTSSITSSSRGH